MQAMGGDIKSFLIATESPQIIYSWFNKEFSNYLQQRWKLQNNDDIGTHFCMKFLPLIVAHFQLKQERGSGCTSIQCKDINCTIHLKQFDDLLYIGITNENDTVIESHLKYLYGFVQSLFGPCNILHLASPRIEQKQRSHEMLNLFLATYLKLHEKEHSLLVDAVENMNVNKLVKDTCTEIVSKTIKMFNTVFEPSHVAFCALIVDCKVLSIESDTNDFTAADVIRFIIFAQCGYTEKTNAVIDEEEYASSAKEAALLSDIESSLATKPIDIPRNDKNCKTNASSSLKTRKNGFMRKDNTSSLLNRSTSHMYKSTYHISDVRRSNSETRVRDHLRNKKISSCFKTNRFHSSERNLSYCRYITNTSKQIPYVIFAAKLKENIKLIILKKFSRSELACVISEFICVIKQMLLYPGVQVSVSRSQQLLQSADELSKKMKSFIKMRKVLNCALFWDKVLCKMVVKCMKTHVDEDIKRLKVGLKQLLTRLGNLYNSIFLQSPIERLEEGRFQLHLIQKNIINHIKDFESYIKIKSQTNTTMTSFMITYPGLLHFVFNFVIAPTFTEFEEDEKISTLIRDKAWEGVYNGYKSLKQTMLQRSCFRDGDFLFSSRFILEKYVPYRVMVKRRSSIEPLSFKSNIPHNWHDQDLIGDNDIFYRNLIKSWDKEVNGTGFYVFKELHCVHFSTVNDVKMNKQNDKLLIQLCSMCE